ncbi:alpha/beta hydrolase [Thalassolituus sp. LLYu03]|uniref:alpha/beta hydrolase n=1 Tax=Thalassolituus sp. LLYu03 TaxID=3421656 RepID=UPI003D2B1073
MNEAIHYSHPFPESVASRLTRVGLTLIGRKSSIAEEMQNQRFRHQPDAIPASVRRQCQISTANLDGRSVWTLTPKEARNDIKVLYLHGGAYIRNIVRQQWTMMGQLCVKTGATIIIPDYPLAPEFSWQDAHEFVGKLWQQLTQEHAAGDIILMGDSAGGGLALSFAQTLAEAGQPQPKQLLLLSPWLDLASNNPGMLKINPYDQMLEPLGLRLAANAWARGTTLDDYRVSPLYGEYKNLAPLTIFIGTGDILFPDVVKLREKLAAEHIPLNYFVFPRMMHVWMAVDWMPEARSAIKRIAAMIRGDLPQPPSA